MNPQWHDEFVALCALFPSGELTEEEWALLQVHLAYCDSCRVIFEQYQHLAEEVMPAVAATAYPELTMSTELPAFSMEEAEQRLMSRLDSVPPNGQLSAPLRFPSRVYGGLMAACITLGAGLVYLHFIHTAPQSASNATLLPKLQVLSPQSSLPSSAHTGNALQIETADAAKLREQLGAAEARSKQLSVSLAAVEQQVKAEQSDRDNAARERDALGQQLAAAQTETQSLRDKVAAADVAATQQAMRSTSLEAKLHDLTGTVDEKDRMLALDKEFLDHDREIRDLIGARDLYIADIYDVAQTGKTSKPFGRVFYTKDRSLIFYGYDLDKQTGLKQSVTFQAWGSGDDKQDVSLGLFYQDDTHKRWVLRFNDPKTLARLNKVFVTAEPQGGSTKPTGKPLLMAYLQMQPNHP